MNRQITTTILSSWLIGGLLLADGSVQQNINNKQTIIAQALAEAREDLRISELTFAHIQRQLNALRGQPDVDPATLQDYSLYLEKVRAMMEAHRKFVAEIEALNPELAPKAPTARRTVTAERYDPPIPESQDELARLDRQLDEELAAFDAFLLKEQYEAIRRIEQDQDAASEELTSLAREAAAAVERLRKKGIEIDTRPPGDCKDCQGGKGEQPEQEAGGSQDKSGTGGQSEPPGSGQRPAGQGEQPGAEGEKPGAEQGEAGEKKPGEEGSGKPGEGQDSGGSDKKGTGQDGGSGAGASGSGKPTTTQPSGSSKPGAGDSDAPSRPADLPPASDDDIVARQLREAAEKETDPVLKEKLWEEYRKYKASS